MYWLTYSFARALTYLLLTYLYMYTYTVGAHASRQKTLVVILCIV